MARPIENAHLVVRSLIGNALEHEPDHYSRYIREVKKETPEVYNPNPQEVATMLVDETSQALIQRPQAREALVTLPWPSRRGVKEKIHPSRAASAIIAYADVHGKKIADEYFPVEQMQSFLAGIQARSAQVNRALTIPEQYGVALSQTDNNPVAAAVLAHSAYRAIARNKDTRLSETLRFPLDEILTVARSTADFHTVDSPSRDPLGDTYHWWASYTAGLVFTLSQDDHAIPIQANFLTGMFHHEAALTTLVRKHMLHLTEITNHHKDVDRQGLQTGITVGNFLKTALLAPSGVQAG